MFVLVRFTVEGDASTLWEGLAAQTDPLGDTRLGVEQSWYGPDGAFYVLLSNVETPGVPSQLAATVVSGLPLKLTEIVRGDRSVELGHEDGIVIGLTREEVLDSLPPGYATCAICQADLTIEDHNRPPCPTR